MLRSRLLPLLLAVTLAPAAFGQITSFVGRYLNNDPAHRINDVRVAPELDRIFAKTQATSAAFLIWRLSTFPNDVQGFGGPLLPPLVVVDPSDPSSGWSYVAFDGAGLVDFDWDDRGYIYLSYDGNGFGIVNASGQLQSQINFETTNQIKVIPSGGHYYALVNAAGGTRVYDVTNPSSPQLIRTLALPFTSIARAGDRVAVVTSAQDVRFFFSAATLIAGGAADQIFNDHHYFMAATDGVHFFAGGAELSPDLVHLNTVVTMFTPGAPAYIGSTNTIGSRFFQKLYYGSGALVLTMTKTSGTPSSAGIIYTIENGALVAHDITTQLEGLYPTTPPAVMNSFAVGGQHYLITSQRVTGDLYTLSSTLFASAGAATDIPTTSQWGLLSIALALMAIAAMRLRG